MKLVCIGVGGTGSSCIEAIVHLAALGYYPDGCDVDTLVVDPDVGHPVAGRIRAFTKAYQEVLSGPRGERKIPDALRGGAFGARIETLADASLHPAGKSNLYTVLGLGGDAEAALARAFFPEELVARADSQAFAKGFYGWANAGSCFFCDQENLAKLVAKVKGRVQEPGSAVVVYGSAFGGTGAAGLLRVAKALWEDAGIGKRGVPVGAVQLEPYFLPDEDSIPEKDRFANHPSTFFRRTGTAYAYEERLARAGGLSLRRIFMLGSRSQIRYPGGDLKDAFNKKDMQDNPPHWVEYLAAAAAEEVLALCNKDDDGGARVCLRSVTHGKANATGHDTARIRRKLHTAAAAKRIIEDVIFGVLDAAGSKGQLPGHPWLHDVLSESALNPDLLRRHLDKARQDVLGPVLARAGALAVSEGDANVRALAEKRRELVRESFPDKAFAPDVDVTPLTSTLEGADVGAVFASYAVVSDGVAPVRALLRWSEAAVKVLPDNDIPKPAADLQLVRQNGDEKVDTGTRFNLSSPPPGRFQEFDLVTSLTELAGADWRPGGVRAVSGREDMTPLEARELPTIWAPAIVHEKGLRVSKPNDEIALLHLGLLFHLMIAPGGSDGQRHRRPVFLVDIGRKFDGTFREALTATLPLTGTPLDTCFAKERALVLCAAGWDLSLTPKPKQVLGFLYPTTIVVPAESLSSADRTTLVNIGVESRAHGFPAWMKRKLTGGTGMKSDLQKVLKSSGLADHEVVADNLYTFLDSVDLKTPEPGGGWDARAYHPLAGSVGAVQLAPWLQQL